jgi:hypothetical protein
MSVPTTEEEMTEKLKALGLPIDYVTRPKPGTTFSERKEFIDNCRFLDIRNTVYHVYKNSDGTPLLNYHETLDNRNLTKERMIQYEVAKELVYHATGAEAVVQPQSNTESTTNMINPPIATPTQAAQVAAGPATTMTDDTTTGATARKRPTKSAGASVAPPPAAPPPSFPASTAGYAPPQMPSPVSAAPASFPAPAAPVSPTVAAVTLPMVTGMTPAAPTFTPVPVTTTPASTSTPIPATFTPATAESVYIGGGVASTTTATIPQLSELQNSVETILAEITGLKAEETVSATNVSVLTTQVQGLAGQVDSLTTLVRTQASTISQILVALHHLYLTNPATAQNAAGKNTLPEFQTYLQQYVGNPQ